MVQITISDTELVCIMNALAACKPVSGNITIDTVICKLKRLPSGKGPFILSQGLTLPSTRDIVNCRCGRQVASNATCECGMRHESIKKEDTKP